MIEGRAGDEAHATLPSQELLDGLQRLSATLVSEGSSISKLGAARVIECLTGSIPHA